MGRWDAERVTGIDPLNAMYPFVMPKRTEAEVSLKETFDITELNKYIKQHNEETGSEYKLFHCVCTAVGKTIYHRPLLNRFISGKRYWKRKDIILSFVCKQKFADDGQESLMWLKIKDEMTLDDISKIILGDTKKVRENGSNDLDALMGFIMKLPRFVISFIFWALQKLEYYGIVFKGLTQGDANYSTVLLSNLGSIKANSCYHHLSNYGTNSIMITIGTMRKEEINGEMHDVVDMTFNLDERIADGFYFAKSLRLPKYIFAHPEMLNERIDAPIPEEIFK